MKIENPKRYKVAGLGEWGLEDGLVYENWEIADFNVNSLVRDTSSAIAQKRLISAFGLDFGYTNDPTALCCMLVDPYKRIIYVFDEMYGFGMSNRNIYEKIYSMGYGKEKIFADSAEPKSIDELYNLGLKGVRRTRKGPDSINHGIQFIQGHKIMVLPKCVNFIKEISAYTWARKTFGRGVNFSGGDANRGCLINKPAGGFDHLMDAMRYGLSAVCSGERWGF